MYRKDVKKLPVVSPFLFFLFQNVRTENDVMHSLPDKVPMRRWFVHICSFDTHAPDDIDHHCIKCLRSRITNHPTVLGSSVGLPSSGLQVPYPTEDAEVDKIIRRPTLRRHSCPWLFRDVQPQSFNHSKPITLMHVDSRLLRGTGLRSIFDGHVPSL